MSPAPNSHPVEAKRRAGSDWIARIVKYAPRVRHRVSIASGLLNRNIITATGVRAIRVPAISPAILPLVRLTARYSTHTAAMPMSACGSSTVRELKPKRRANSAGIQ